MVGAMPKATLYGPVICWEELIINIEKVQRGGVDIEQAEIRYEYNAKKLAPDSADIESAS